MTQNLHVHLHADCQPVRGVTRSAIYDLTRHEIVLFPTPYYDLLMRLSRQQIGKELDNAKTDEERVKIIDFISYLIENELAELSNSSLSFPEIDASWDAPGIIQNAIIDVDERGHDFDRIFSQLNSVGCRYVQVRSFQNHLQLKDLQEITTSAHHKSIESIEFIVRFSAELSSNDLVRLVKRNPIIVGLTVHSAPTDSRESVSLSDGLGAESYGHRTISFRKQVVRSERSCGQITLRLLNAPATSTFFELKRYNGCLNRKVSIDAEGFIRNCPSMKESFGSVTTTDIKQVVTRAEFQFYWAINKDKIAVCRDCEFRYSCSDCRAYLEDPRDHTSKPLKCGYDPYTARWEDWSNHPHKLAAKKYYAIEDEGGSD